MIAEFPSRIGPALLQQDADFTGYRDPVPEQADLAPSRCMVRTVPYDGRMDGRSNGLDVPLSTLHGRRIGMTAESRMDGHSVLWRSTRLQRKPILRKAKNAISPQAAALVNESITRNYMRFFLACVQHLLPGL